MKRKNKTKEDVITQLKKSQDFVKKMAFVKKEFYPALVEATRSIEDAQTFLSSLSTMVMQEFLATMKDKKVADLKLASKLDPKDDMHDSLVKLVSLFDDKTMFDAKELIEGMRSEITLFLNDENRNRPLSALTTRWVDELLDDKRTNES